MGTGLAQRYADFLMRYSRPVLVVLLLATVLIGSGAGNIDSGLTIASFGSDSTEAKKLDYVQKNFSNDRENTTAMQVIIRGDNVLSKKSLLDTLRFQRALRENETVNSTLVETQPTVGISNQIAIAAIQQRIQSRNNSVRNTNGDEIPELLTVVRKPGNRGAYRHSTSRSHNSSRCRPPKSRR